MDGGVKWKGAAAWRKAKQSFVGTMAVGGGVKWKAAASQVKIYLPK